MNRLIHRPSEWSGKRPFRRVPASLRWPTFPTALQGPQQGIVPHLHCEDVDHPTLPLSGKPLLQLVRLPEEPAGTDVLSARCFEETEVSGHTPGYLSTAGQNSVSGAREADSLEGSSPDSSAHSETGLLPQDGPVAIGSWLARSVSDQLWRCCAVDSVV